MNKQLGQYLVLNIIGLALVYSAFQAGLVHPIYLTDESYITSITTILFLIGLFLCGWKIATLKLRFSELLADHVSEENIEIWVEEKIITVRMIMNMLPFLGLTGTVIGIIIGLPEESVTLGELEADKELVIQFLVGLRIAFNTTLVGCITYIWMRLCYRFLETRVNKLLYRMAN